MKKPKRSKKVLARKGRKIFALARNERLPQGAELVIVTDFTNGY